MRGHTELGHLVHVLGTKLNFDHLVAITIDHGVNRLIAVRLWIGDVIVKLFFDMGPAAVDDTQGSVAVLDLVHDHAYRTHIVELAKRQMLALHLAPNRVDMLRTAIDFGVLNPVLLEQGTQFRHKVLNITLTLDALLTQVARNLLIVIVMEEAEGEIFKLPLELTDTQAVSQRGVDIGNLAGDRELGLIISVLGSTDHRNTLGQLDNYGAHIIDHRQEHATDAVDLGLSALTRVEVL